MDPSLILLDDPAPMVRRITLNRPEKRNALNATLRREILAATRDADRDDSVRVTIIRGAGKCFSAGYDLSGDPNAQGEPLDYNAEGEGSYMRGVTNGWMSIWDLAKPVIAQVHGYCLAGGSELATGCDLVYVAEDAKIGYPAVRFGTPDMQYHAWLFGMRAGMESMLTGDSFSGVEAAQLGWANRAYPEADLEAQVLAVATRIAQIPTDLVQINKRTVHRAMEVMGLRSSIRAGTELSALATHTESMKKFVSGIQSGGLRAALDERDTPFGDYRTSEPHDA
ncbi:MAG TPA: enoyl-CoA hydratase-related protein [Acidimicrobiia bacterium]|jgi:enoyl-CoA hydratase